MRHREKRQNLPSIKLYASYRSSHKYRSEYIVDDLRDRMMNLWNSPWLVAAPVDY